MNKGNNLGSHKRGSGNGTEYTIGVRVSSIMALLLRSRGVSVKPTWHKHAHLYHSTIVLLPCSVLPYAVQDISSYHID